MRQAISRPGMSLPHIRFDPGAPELLNSDVPAEVTVQLRGNTFFDMPDDDPFLPASAGDQSVFDLLGYGILGETLKGIHPRMVCQPPGGGGLDIIPLGVPSTLTIRAE